MFVFESNVLYTNCFSLMTNFINSLFNVHIKHFAYIWVEGLHRKYFLNS